MLDELTAFHIKNSYFIEVFNSKKGCVAKFPKNILHKPKFPELIIEYNITKDGLSIEYDDKKINQITSKYTTRLLIQSDIIIKAVDRDINLKLIKFFKNFEIKNKIFDILNIKLTKEEKILEKKLAENICDIVFNIMDEQTADNLGILDGFQSIRHLAKIGGF